MEVLKPTTRKYQGTTAPQAAESAPLATSISPLPTFYLVFNPSLYNIVYSLLVH